MSINAAARGTNSILAPATRSTIPLALKYVHVDATRAKSFTSRFNSTSSNTSVGNFPKVPISHSPPRRPSPLRVSLRRSDALKPLSRARHRAQPSFLVRRRRHLVPHRAHRRLFCIAIARRQSFIALHRFSSSVVASSLRRFVASSRLRAPCPSVAFRSPPALGALPRRRPSTLSLPSPRSIAPYAHVVVVVARVCPCHRVAVARRSPAASSGASRASDARAVDMRAVGDGDEPPTFARRARRARRATDDGRASRNDATVARGKLNGLFCIFRAETEANRPRKEERRARRGRRREVARFTWRSIILKLNMPGIVKASMRARGKRARERTRDD